MAMRIAAVLLCAALTVSASRAEPLSSADREALIESLDKLRESAGARVDARFRLAIQAYRDAMVSNEAAIEFYLKCIEKVNFEDQQKKAIDFREWKRKETDRLSEAGFRLALRYQLRWLVLTLQAASENADQAAIAETARTVVDALFLDAEQLGPHEQTLSQAVTSSVFAQAYEISGLEKDTFPLSPTALEQIYEKVVFPSLRTPARLEFLRAAWIRRIQQEGIKVEHWSAPARGGAKRNGQEAAARPDNSAAVAEFTAETLPKLQWDMEMDLFSNGDEGGAAKRMLAHIEKYISHESAREWSEEFKTLLAPPVVTSPEPTAAVETRPGFEPQE